MGVLVGVVGIGVSVGVTAIGVLVGVGATAVSVGVDITGVRVDVGRTGVLVGVAAEGGSSVGGTVVGSDVAVAGGLLVGVDGTADVGRGVSVGLAATVGVRVGSSGVEAMPVDVGTWATVRGVAVAVDAVTRTSGGATTPRPTGVRRLFRFQAGGVMTSGRSGSMGVIGWVL
jgi:hypothetical protein